MKRQGILAFVSSFLSSFINVDNISIMLLHGNLGDNFFLPNKDQNNKDGNIISHDLDVTSLLLKHE